MAGGPPTGAWASPAERTVSRRAGSAIDLDRGWTPAAMGCCAGMPTGGGQPASGKAWSAGHGHGWAAPECVRVLGQAVRKARKRTWKLAGNAAKTGAIAPVFAVRDRFPDPGE